MGDVCAILHFCIICQELTDLGCICIIMKVEVWKGILFGVALQPYLEQYFFRSKRSVSWIGLVDILLFMQMCRHTLTINTSADI